MYSSHFFFSGRFLVAHDEGDRIRISIARAMRDHISLRIHRREVRRLLQKQLKGSFAIPCHAREFLLPRPADPESAHDLPLRLRAIDSKLGAITKRPLGPAKLEKLLDISAAERRRWTRDRRLTPSGRAFLKGGQLVSFCTYAPDQVDALLKEPGIIAAWRARDRAEDRVKEMESR